MNRIWPGSRMRLLLMTGGKGTMDGILLVDKPADMTSHDVVMYVRKHFRIKKVGHAGTLDPFATGLLILCLGQATKIAQYLVDRNKEYLAVMKLGETTDTQDYTGRVLERNTLPDLSIDAVVEVFTKFVGEISQIPPMYSAKKVQGRRLYKIARSGKTVERAARNVIIHELELKEMTLPYIRFRVVCSKGTYIRTLTHDIGAVLGCGAHLTELRRTKIGPFTINSAFSLDQLAKMTKRTAKSRCLIPLDEALFFLPAITVNEPASTRLVHGTKIDLTPRESREVTASGFPEQIFRIYSVSGTFIALANGMIITCDGEPRWQFQPIRVFATDR